MPFAMDAALLDQLTSDVETALGGRAAEIFKGAMERTLSDAVVMKDDGTAFVLTGDIPAMWLRDSAAQMRPYVALADRDPALADLIAAIVRLQLRQVVQDPYANAFNDGPTGAGHQDDDTAMTPYTWERKYEVDSLAFPIQLAHQLWQITGRTDHLDELAQAARAIIDTARTEQDHANSTYRFERSDCRASDTLAGGHGTAVAVTGMTWSGFRPSDDACEYHYNVPGNLFLVASLEQIAQLSRQVLGNEALAVEAEDFAAQLRAAIAEHGVVEHPTAGRIWAYEVDGLGNHLLMDDANMPSLLSLPLTGAISDTDELYRATRAFVLSEANPTWAVGATGEGMGSPHTPPRWVWPIAAAVRGLTATDDAEKRAVIASLVANNPRGRMCESYDVDDNSRYTREWFSWADSMFCELALDVVGVRVPR